MKNKDRLKIYCLEICLLLFLFFTLFESDIISKLVLSIVLLSYMLICLFTLRRKKDFPIYTKQVTILMIVFAFIYLAVFYLMGLYFGFYNATVKLSLWSIINYIIPLTIIIISTEIIRYILITQNVKRNKSLVLLITILIDLIIYTGIYDLTNLSDILTVIGFIAFASITCNLLYNYISIRFGYKSIIIFRLITVLYAYFIPIIPDVYVFFRSVLRMIYPYIIYIVLEYTYAKNNKATEFINQKNKNFKTTISIVFAVLIAMLVSCQFKYGILVIGSGSMTGSIDKGDAVIFEQYDKQNISVGDVIIFNRDKIRIVHRVIEIKEINHQKRYYTKGDANAKVDDGYVTDSDILGITKFKIKYIGFPSIWLNDIFS